MRISVDDGCRLDLKVAELAKKYKIDCIFYIPVEWQSLAMRKEYEPLTFNDLLKLAKDFEIGSHTITHPKLTRIPYDMAFHEIVDSKDMLSRIIGKPVNKFCPPRGYLNEQLTELVNENYDSYRLTVGEGLVHVHPKSGVNGNNHWTELVDKSTKEIWLHSIDLEEYDEWDNLEKVLNEYSHT